VKVESRNQKAEGRKQQPQRGSGSAALSHIMGFGEVRKDPTTNNETLLFLLKGGHLSMAERLTRGVWPHPPLSFGAVAIFLAKTLEQGERWFPYEWEPHRPGQIVREGGTIERQGENRYVYRNASAQAASPTTLNRFNETEFSDPLDAAVHYLRWDLHLPGDLDGWKVVR
jgi:hypothetical protein